MSGSMHSSSWEALKIKIQWVSRGQALLWAV